MAVTTQYESIIASLLKERDALVREIARVDAAISNLGGDAIVDAPPQPVVGFVIEQHPVGLFAPVPRTSTVVSHRNRNAPVPDPPAAPNHGITPIGAEDDWVSILAADASPLALGYALLKLTPEPTITSATFNTALGRIRGVKGGVGYIVVDRLLKAGIIEATNIDNQWRILDRSQGGILQDGFLWADGKQLNNYDWAAIRREAIILLLQKAPDTSTAVITKSLLKANWLKAPVDPHLIKADLRFMEKNRIVKQDEETRKWSLA